MPGKLAGGAVVVPHHMVARNTQSFYDNGVSYRSSQDFKEIRSRCLAEDRLFEDPEFSPPPGSKWRRPSEISDNPQFFVDGPSRFDVNQGYIGDCWLLAAMASLALHKKPFSHVVPKDQGFDKDYAGVFHFRLWQFGNWVEVVIDDRLPTYARGGLRYLYSKNKNEFWSVLLEKAFAKLMGAYENLVANSNDAMISFTGGITETHTKITPEYYSILLKAFERNSLMVANRWGMVKSNLPGIFGNHAYSITGVKYVDTKDPGVGKIPLIRLRNPWGTWNEWKGPWSDRSTEWISISQSEKEELGLTFDLDGEFWMSYEDFRKHFNGVHICHWDPKNTPEGSTKKWESSHFVAEWVKGVTASGCSRNPQFTVTLTDPDEGDDENNCTMIVAIRHPMDRRFKGRKSIGYKVYKLPDNNPVYMPIDVNEFKDSFVGSSQAKGESIARFKLEPGMYVIVPNKGPDLEGRFMLQVFTEKPHILVAHVGENLRDADSEDRVKELPANTEPADKA